jgi:hypothetical protein
MQTEKNSVFWNWQGAVLVLVLILVPIVFYLISGSSAPAVEFELVGCERVRDLERFPDGGIRCRAVIQSGASDKQIRMVSKRINKRVLFEHEGPVAIILFYHIRQQAEEANKDQLVEVIHQDKHYQIIRQHQKY